MRREHLTPDGWKPCAASQKECKYEQRVAPLDAAAFIDSAVEAVEAGKPNAVKSFFNSLFGEKKQPSPEPVGQQSQVVTLPQPVSNELTAPILRRDELFSRAVQKNVTCFDCDTTEVINAYTVTPRVKDPTKDETDFACPKCSKTLSREEGKRLDDWDSFPCQCGYTLNLFDTEIEVLVQPKDASLLDKSEVRQRTWFHSTSSPDWLEQVTAAGKYAHVGSLEAATDRATVKSQNKDANEQKTYLWELRVKPEAVIAGDLMRDDSDWLETVSPCSKDHLGGDVQRYINKFESAGSISLLIDPRQMEAVRVTEL